MDLKSYKKEVFDTLMADVETCEYDANKHMDMAKDLIRNCYDAGISAEDCVYEICTTYGIC